MPRYPKAINRSAQAIMAVELIDAVVKSSLWSLARWMPEKTDARPTTPAIRVNKEKYKVATLPKKSGEKNNFHQNNSTPSSSSCSWKPTHLLVPSITLSVTHPAIESTITYNAKFNRRSGPMFARSKYLNAILNFGINLYYSNMYWKVLSVYKWEMIGMQFQVEWAIIWKRRRMSI